MSNKTKAGNYVLHLREATRVSLAKSAFEELHFAKILASALLNGFKITRAEWKLFGFAKRIRARKGVGANERILFLLKLEMERS